MYPTLSFIKQASRQFCLGAVGLIFSLQAVAQYDITPEDKKLFEQTKVAAQNNDTKAQYELAGMYLSGIGVLQNQKNAQLWAEKSAKAGNADAYSLLADIIFIGGDRAFTEEFVKAREYATKAVEGGSVRGKVSLAEALITPESGSVDYPKAIALLEEVSALNSQDQFMAPLWLGIIYYDGNGVPMNEKKALEWFAKADALTFAGFAEGQASFQFNDGNNGTVRDDEQKATKLRAMACELGKKEGNEMYCY
ncbi:Putative beta-lactamase hcpC precursor [Providencia rustigianii]|uniref:tetratricopeptide repeat protein n=1 Tax=Providencia TaxID=586 RepID=UPI000D8BF8DD|nr:MULTISPECIES: tetratricopeptide repeat protein [Providencia]MTC57317.1 sel1 repeat family protein [Providencia rustigianii]SPY77439.1 Putative beta-lactamase hcpC precursor [Providencia rustigianii]VEB69370.1 Putative beta-lactamase hcpC precursor [Providencia rustigianii]